MAGNYVSLADWRLSEFVVNIQFQGSWLEALMLYLSIHPFDDSLGLLNWPKASSIKPSKEILREG